MKKHIVLFAGLACLVAMPASAFTIDFNWDGLKLCTSGNPNRVSNPTFTLKNVPEDTAYIRFKLKAQFTNRMH